MRVFLGFFFFFPGWFFCGANPRGGVFGFVFLGGGGGGGSFCICENHVEKLSTLRRKNLRVS